MDEAFRDPVDTRRDGLAVPIELTGEVFTRRVITVVLALITALTFAFGFGDVWALERSLGVPAFVSPLVGPAVDFVGGRPADRHQAAVDGGGAARAEGYSVITRAQVGTRWRVLY